MKEEVILRILVQESPKSELRLQRYGEKKLWGPFCNFWEVARGIFGNILKTRVFLKICGLQVDYNETEGPLHKFPEIIDFQIYFSIEYHGGLSPWLMD
jgi:hypothetical protein